MVVIAALIILTGVWMLATIIGAMITSGGPLGLLKKFFTALVGLD
jgi:hypothetical protein